MDQDEVMTSRIRTAAEILLGPVTIQRHLPASAGGGAIYASGRVGGLKYLLKPASAWDPELLWIAETLVRTGDSVWDVGANVGLFSRAAGHFAGSNGAVISIEADVDAVRLLNRTCQLSAPGHAAMTVLPIAVSEATGFIRFSIAKRARAANAIEGFGSTQTGGVKETRVLPCFPLDALLGHFRRPDVLKIDVEGAECMVLRGAETILRDIRPLIYCEVQDQSRAEVVGLLEGYGYVLRDGVDYRGGDDGATVTSSTSNLVGIPQERVMAAKGSA
jgi:FkbM family methyltransferase